MADATASPGVIASTVSIGATVAQEGARPTPSAISVPSTLPAVTNLTVEEVSSGRITFGGAGALSLTSRLIGYGQYATDDRGPEYNVVVLTPDGFRQCSLENAIVGKMSWVLNGAGSASFILPTDDPKAFYVRTAETEVQIWRGPDLLWQGVVVRARGDEKTVEFQCIDLSWYLTRRVVGKAETNYIANGSFEAGLENWFPAQYAPTESGAGRNTAYWTQEIRSSVAGTTPPVKPIDGEKMLYQHSQFMDQIYFGIKAAQLFEWTVDEVQSPEGDVWSVVAWCYIPSSEWYSARVTPYTWGDDTAPTGISFARLSTTETRTHFVPGVGWRTDPEDIELIRIPIDDSTPRDTWVRLEAPLEQPVVAGSTELLVLLLETPVGGIYWDNISLVRNERLYFNNVDQTEIMKQLVIHAQDSMTGGKSDLRIDLDCRPSGIKRTRIYEYFNHEVISDLLDEFPGLWQGADWSIEITPTTRTFTTHYPRRGTTKPQYALALGTNIASITMSVDGEQTANSVIVMADAGEGAAREEGSAIDTTTLSGGLVLEKVYNATPGSTVNTLQAQADRGVRRYKDPVTMLTITVFQQFNNELLGMVAPGDVVPVQIDHGWYDLDANYRIVEIALDPRTEEMEISINPEINWSLDPLA